MFNELKNKIKDCIKYHKSWIKWLFRKDEIDFDKDLTVQDIVNAVKSGNIFTMRKIMPKFNIGKNRLSRRQSFLFLIGSFMGCAGMSIYFGNPLPMLLFLGSISYGSEYVFNSGITGYISASALDATHFVMGYTDSGNSDKGTAIIGTVANGNEVSWGSEYIFNNITTTHLGVAALSSTVFVVVYKDTGGDTYGHAKVGTVTGSAISYGAETTYNAASNTTYNCVSKLDATKFVVAYYDGGNSGYGTAIMGTVSGTTISYGAEAVFNSLDTNHISISGLSATSFVVGYKDPCGDTYGHCKIGTISGTTITFGSEYVFNSVNTEYISVAGLNSTSFVVGYRDVGGDTYGCCRIGTVSGTTISYGTEAIFNAASTLYISASALDSTHFVVSYDDAGNSSHGTARLGTISGTTISYGDEYVFNAAATIYISASALDSTHFVVGYKDEGNSNYGTGIIGTVTYPGAYEIDITAGSFTFTGIATSFSKGYTSVCSSGSFSFTGISALLNKGYNCACDVGAFTLTGIATLFGRGITFVCSAGSFTLTGISALLNKGYTAICSVGSFALTGIATSFSRGITVACSVGSFVLTGIDVTLTKSAEKILAGVGSFILTGKNVALTFKTKFIYTKETKPVTVFTEESKPSTSHTKETKPVTVFTEESKP